MSDNAESIPGGILYGNRNESLGAETRTPNEDYPRVVASAEAGSNYSFGRQQDLARGQVDERRVDYAEPAEARLRIVDGDARLYNSDGERDVVATIGGLVDKVA